MKNIWNSIKAWCQDNDWWYLAVIGAILLGFVVYNHLWGLLIILGGTGVGVFVAEYVYIKMHNISVSDYYREWRLTNKHQSRIILSLLALLIAALIYHFTRKPNV